MGAKKVKGLWRVMLLGVVVILCSASAGWAGIINGDFEAVDSLEGWTYSNVITDSSYGDYISTIERLHASGHFVWNNPGWSGSKTDASLLQSSIVLQEGQTVLRFDAAAVASPCAGSMWMSTISWEATSGGTGSGFEAITSGTWRTYSIPVLDWVGQPYVAGAVITITAGCQLIYPGGPPEGQQEIWPTADLWVDNFQLVPEPATLLLFGFGVFALRKRHRA